MHSAVNPMSQFDADRLGPHLYQGSAPRSASHVRAAGFDTLVLCAEEIQPPDFVLDGLHVLRCPLNDDPTVPLPEKAKRRAARTAQAVARRVRTGSRVLVTCAQGRNRSGLVSALTLHLLTGRPGRDCVTHVRMCRPNALSNPRFVEWLLLF